MCSTYGRDLKRPPFFFSLFDFSSQIEQNETNNKEKGMNYENV